MHDDPKEAAVWCIELCPSSFRSQTGDVAVEIKEGRTGRRLCSRRVRTAGADAGAVDLLTLEQSEQRDALGNYIWNCAWECVPDDDDVLAAATATAADQQFLKFLELES